MAQKFHVSKNGEPGVCRAQEGNCPLGSSDEHYSSKEDAAKAYEERNAQSTLPQTSKKGTAKGLSPKEFENLNYEDTLVRKRETGNATLAQEYFPVSIRDDYDPELNDTPDDERGVWVAPVDASLNHSDVTDAAEFVSYQELTSENNGVHWEKRPRSEVKANDASSASKTRAHPEPTERGIKAYQGLVESYRKYWGGESNPRKEFLYQKRANHDPSNTQDGAWYPNRPDGGVVVPKGTYYWVYTDDWQGGLDDNDGETADGEYIASPYDRAMDWEDEVTTATPPGTVQGAYFNGKPSFFIASEENPHDGGYAGEYLMNESMYNEIYAGEKRHTTVEVTEDTVLYGYRGNPNETPDGAYTHHLMPDEFTPELGKFYQETLGHPPGSIANNPDIKTGWKGAKF